MHEARKSIAARKFLSRTEEGSGQAAIVRAPIGPLLFLLLQISGALLIVFGAAHGVRVWGIGWILLVPGTLMAALVPLELVLHHQFWYSLGTTPQAVGNSLFFPLAILINFGVYTLLRRLLRTPETCNAEESL